MLSSLKVFQFACMLASLVMVGSLLDDVQARRAQTVQSWDDNQHPELLEKVARSKNKRR